MDDFKLEGEELPKEEPVSSWETFYARYLKSAYWKNVRKAMINYAGGKCQSKLGKEHSSRLEVHHLHYKTLFKESFKDLKVVCSLCHRLEDAKRDEHTHYVRENRRIERAFDTYMDKKYGQNLWNGYNIHQDYEEFLDWLERKEWERYW